MNEAEKFLDNLMVANPALHEAVRGQIMRDYFKEMGKRGGAARLGSSREEAVRIGSLGGKRKAERRKQT